MKVRKEADIRNPYNQIPLLTQDTISESDENTRKHHIQESQEVSPFKAGDHNFKAARNRQDSMTRNTSNKKDPYKKRRLGTVSTKITDGAFYVFFLSCVCHVFVRVCLYVLCGHLLGKG